MRILLVEQGPALAAISLRLNPANSRRPTRVATVLPGNHLNPRRASQASRVSNPFRAGQGLVPPAPSPGLRRRCTLAVEASIRLVARRRRPPLRVRPIQIQRRILTRRRTTLSPRLQTRLPPDTAHRRKLRAEAVSELPQPVHRREVTALRARRRRVSTAIRPLLLPAVNTGPHPVLLHLVGNTAVLLLEDTVRPAVDTVLLLEGTVLPAEALPEATVRLAVVLLPSVTGRPVVRLLVGMVLQVVLLPAVTGHPVVRLPVVTALPAVLPRGVMVLPAAVLLVGTVLPAVLPAGTVLPAAVLLVGTVLPAAVLLVGTVLRVATVLRAVLRLGVLVRRSSRRLVTARHHLRPVAVRASGNRWRPSPLRGPGSRRILAGLPFRSRSHGS